MIIPIITALSVLLVFAALYFFLAPESWTFKKRLKKYASRSNAQDIEDNKKHEKFNGSISQKQSANSDFVFQKFGGDPGSLRAKLLQAGLKISTTEFLFYQLLIAALIVCGTIFLVNASPLYGIILGVVTGAIVPRMWLKSKIRKRVDAFNKLFPDAVDMMLSVTKSGLPLINALQSVAENSFDPVKSEFRRICSEVNLGVQLADAVGKTVERVPSQEMAFFAISISIQLETGGSLTNTFNNLAKTLRNRQDLKRMISSKSSEAKMQAKVLSGIIIFIVGVLYAMDPAYVGVFWKDDVGKQVGLALLGWMAVGFYMMNSMTKFEY